MLNILEQIEITLYFKKSLQITNLMKTHNSFSQPHSINKKIVKIAGSNKLLKTFLALVMLSCLTLLTSCFYPCCGPGNYGDHGYHHGYRMDHGYHGDHDNHGYYGHHGEH